MSKLTKNEIKTQRSLNEQAIQAKRYDILETIFSEFDSFKEWLQYLLDMDYADIYEEEVSTCIKALDPEYVLIAATDLDYLRENIDSVQSALDTFKRNIANLKQGDELE